MDDGQDGDVPDWDLADRMRKALRHAGVSTGEMAGYLGVSRQSVGNWISGRVDPSFQTVRLWSIRTGVPLEWVLGRTLVPAGRGKLIPVGGGLSPSTNGSLSPAAALPLNCKSEGALAA